MDEPTEKEQITTLSEALDAIHDIALILMQKDLSDDVDEGLDLILSIARYKTDMRTDAEKKNSESTK